MYQFHICVSITTRIISLYRNRMGALNRLPLSVVIIQCYSPYKGHTRYHKKKVSDPLEEETCDFKSVGAFLCGVSQLNVVLVDFNERIFLLLLEFFDVE